MLNIREIFPSWKNTIRLAALLALLLLTACARWPLSPPPQIAVPEPLRPPVSETESALVLQQEQAAAEPRTRFGKTPAPPPAPDVEVVRPRASGPALKGPELTVNFDSIALPAFINEVYGNILGQSFVLSPDLEGRKDLVTLRVTEPQSPQQIFELANQVLDTYGVAVERQGDLLNFSRATGRSAGEPPLLASGRTLPGVPASHRPIFQFVPLHAVRNTDVAGWLRRAYKGQPLDIAEDSGRNAVILTGAPDVVGEALQAVKLLDQPNMKGRQSLRIEPAFQTPGELAKNLVDVLKTEGYGAGSNPDMGSVTVLPVESVNAVLVFAASDELLDHVRQWAEELDRPSRQSAEGGLFYYGVRNTRAETIASVLNQVLGGVVRIENKDGASASATAGASGKNALVVDEARNALLYQGDSRDWERIMPIIQDMDRPPQQVLVEVTIAEVTLSNDEEMGIEWVLRNADIGNAAGVIGTLDGLGIGSSGLTYTLDNAGDFRLVLNAFATNDRVSILSNPRVMVKSGETATIDVGNEVPLVTSQSTAPDLQTDGQSSILQSIQYRKTGMILEVKPVIHAGRRVDLEVSQEVSEAQPNTISNISSPSIFSRKVSTSLSLQDGGSVLIGGLISSNGSQGESGVPFLSKIPLLGRLFRVDRQNSARTELIVLIVPYVVGNHAEAAGVTDAFRSRLSFDNPVQGDEAQKQVEE